MRPTAPGATARIYVCGITPYDATHLGHAATYLAFDLVHRLWLDAGHGVHYVQNVTDVDDPLLERAAATGETGRRWPTRETALFREDMPALRVLPPRDYVGVVESVQEIAEAVAKLLLDDQRRYRLEDPTSTPTVGDGRFGYESQLLARADARSCSPSAAAIRTAPGKRHPLDALLWRGRRPGEPSWDDRRSAPGRPGWHVECSVIAMQPAGHGHRRAGRRVGPAVSAPRVLGRARRGADRRAAFRPALRARRHDRARRGEDEQVPGQPGVRLQAARRPASTRWRCGWRCWTATTGPTGNGPAAGCRRPSGGWPAGGSAVAAPAGPDGRGAAPQLRDRLADDLDTAGALAAVDRVGPASAGSRAVPWTRRPRSWWLARWTRCSASSCNRRPR